jgi:hypothetical protein
VRGKEHSFEVAFVKEQLQRIIPGRACLRMPDPAARNARAFSDITVLRLKKKEGKREKSSSSALVAMRRSRCTRKSCRTKSKKKRGKIGQKERGKRKEQLQSILPERDRDRVLYSAMRARGMALRYPPQKKSCFTQAARCRCAHEDKVRCFKKKWKKITTNERPATKEREFIKRKINK